LRRLVCSIGNTSPSPKEDSDFIRVRVRGVFPRTGSQQFIDGQRVDDAVARPLAPDPTAALISMRARSRP
jgi:hypothetical protein